MNRRIVLPLGVFIAILAVVLVYWKVAGGEDTSEPKTSLDYAEPPEVDKTTPKRGLDTSGGVGLDYKHRDKHGNLVARCQAESWDKQSKTVFLLNKPVVTFYTKDGKTISLRGDKARVQGEEISRSVKVLQGTITGDVLLTVDISEERTDVPLAQRPEDKLEIYLDFAEFDNDSLQIESEGPVTLLSKDIDLYGEGLSLAWNQSPDELRLLRIERGEKLIVRSLPGQLADADAKDDKTEDATGKTGEKTGTGKSAKPPVGKNDAADELDEIPDWTPPVSDEYAVLVQPKPAATQPATRPITAVTTKPAATQPDKETTRPKEKNVLKAVLTDEVNGVHIDQGSTNLRGARTVTIVFRLGEQKTARRRAQPKAKPKPVSSTQPTTVPASQPTTVPASQPENDPDAPMVITWRGPLEIRSVRHEENADNKRVVIIADGKKLKLSTKDSTTTCRRMILRNPEKTVRLLGTDGEPVRLTSVDGLKVVAEGVRFDRQRNLVYLDGKGYIEDVPDEPTTMPEDGDKGKKIKSSGTVKWTKGAVARIKEDKTKQPDGSTSPRMSFEEAKVFGKVELTQFDTGDIIRCDQMHLFMAADDQQGYPTKVIATGNVHATQTDSDVWADKVTVYFAEPVKKASDDRLSPKIDRMIAEGNVRIDSKRKGQPVEMTGEKLTSNSKDNSVLAEGKGSLSFMVTKQLDGKKLDRPRKMKINWSKQMDYRLTERKATFKGDVKLDTPSEHVEGQEMVVFFEETQTKEAADTAEPKPSTEKMKKAAGFDTARFTDMTVVKISVEKDVKVESTLKDDKGNLLSRTSLRTKKGLLTYNVKDDEMNVSGPGSFAAEDYRAPKPKKDEKNSSRNFELDRPSQTYLKWGGTMSYTRTKDKDGKVDGGGEVIAREDVEMVHASGKYLVKQSKLKHVDWGKLLSGRVTTLGCDSLWVKFAKPEEDKATADAGKNTSDAKDLTVGKLTEFKAIGQVLATDGVEIKRKIVAHTLHYTSENKLLRILGTKKKPATLLETNLNTGEVNPMKSPRILWYQQTDKFVVESLKAGGG